MGRVATKAVGNICYEARKRASKWNERLSSREGAAEALGVSVDVINNAERGLYKCMPVELVVAMADEYNAPELLNHYCLHECPIGKCRPVSEERLPIEKVSIKFLKQSKLSDIDEMRERLIDIASDGEIDDEEAKELPLITDFFDELSKTISELKIISEIAAKRSKKKCLSEID